MNVTALPIACSRTGAESQGGPLRSVFHPVARHGDRAEIVGRPALRSHLRTPLARVGARVATAVVGVALTLVLSGCSDLVEHGFLPAAPGDTSDTGRIIRLWNGSWIAALTVGVLVWGLILWSIVVYRRRRGDDTLPPQVRYHLPLEILYTVVPLMMVAVLFAYTRRDQIELLSTDTKPDLTIGVVAKQWSWDFNYVDQNAYETGVQAYLDKGDPDAEREVPTLLLPVGERVQFDLNSRDVIHSFWIPAFLMKMDVIPGVTNRFQVVPEKTGTFRGKCAELCGEYHSAMLFNVRVVDRATFDAHIAELKAAGQSGQLSTNLGRSQTPATPRGGASEVGGQKR